MSIRVHPWLKILLCVVLLISGARAFAATIPEERTNLITAILSEDAAVQQALVMKLVGAKDPITEQALIAWRGGSLYIFETNDTKTPFLLDPVADSESRAKGIRLADGELLKDGKGQPLLFVATDLTPADTDSKLRKVIKTALDLFALANPDPNMRRDAVIKLGQDQNAEYIPFLEAIVAKETSPEVKKAVIEAIATAQLASETEATRLAAIQQLDTMRSINGLSFLQKLESEAKAAPEKFGAPTMTAVRKAIVAIEDYMRWGNLFGTAFRGLSLSAVLLVAALGLAITFGLMGVINMAHGEIMMVGAYSAYVTQNVFKSWFGASGGGFDCYFIAALAVAFVAAATVGLILERGVIRFLYKRPLESLLATWGVSLVLQQIFRHIFGAANVQVSSPSWLSGSFVI